MITLRDQARYDTAIGSITMEECRLISRILIAIGNSWLLRFLLGVRPNALSIAMLGATLGRTPKEMVPLESEIRLAMMKEMGSKDSNGKA